MNTRTVLLLCGLCAAASQAATTTREMWVWKDANGVTHYEDKPTPGARKIQLVGSAPVPAPSPPLQPATTPPAAAPEAKPSREYSSLEFVEPEKDAFFFGPDSEVTATLSILPGLMDGDELVWYLDGNRVEPATNAASYTFKALPRGTHTVIAVIRGPDGEEKIRALSRSFTVRQEAISNPRNVGPALKPKPPTPTPPPKPPPKTNK